MIFTREMKTLPCKGNKTFILRREIEMLKGKTKEENSMRENIDVLIAYNLVDSNGIKLQLRLGRIKGSEDGPFIRDKGYRWSFDGIKIPTPVRARTWFNGFPENVMLDWLKANGWALQSRVAMATGKTVVYELPFFDEPSKGNEDSIKEYKLSEEEYKLSEEAIRRGEDTLKASIRMLCDNGSVMSAIALFRYVHPCKLIDAKNAVDAIRFDNTL